MYASPCQFSMTILLFHVQRISSRSFSDSFLSQFSSTWAALHKLVKRGLRCPLIMPNFPEKACSQLASNPGFPFWIFGTESLGSRLAPNLPPPPPPPPDIGVSTKHFVTPPPYLTSHCRWCLVWQMSQVHAKCLLTLEEVVLGGMIGRSFPLNHGPCLIPSFALLVQDHIRRRSWWRCVLNRGCNWGTQWVGWEGTVLGLLSLTPLVWQLAWGTYNGGLSTVHAYWLITTSNYPTLHAYSC